jgi:hypothetical protein
MFKIEITDDTADALFRDILVQDWQGLKKNVTDLESKFEDLKPHQLEDLEADRRLVAAIETMMEYYIEHEERLSILGSVDTAA